MGSDEQCVGILSKSLAHSCSVPSIHYLFLLVLFVLTVMTPVANRSHQLALNNNACHCLCFQDDACTVTILCGQDDNSLRIQNVFTNEKFCQQLVALDLPFYYYAKKVCMD